MKGRSGRVRVMWLGGGALLCMALVAVGFANAGEEKAGTTAANFLELGAGPRVLGMGGATLGLGQDLGGGAWNPAALGWMEKTSLTLAHSGLENESLQEWAAIGGRVGDSRTCWAVSGLYQGDGSFEGRDASNNPTGSFTASSFAIGAHLARPLGPFVTLGLGVKTVSEKIGDASGFGATFDAGIAVRRGALGFGASARNVGGRMRYDGAAYDFPTTIGAGLAWSHPAGLSLAVDANFPDAYYNDVRAGLEYRWTQAAIRAGYRHEVGAIADPLTGPTFGLGAGRNGYWLDYGYLLGGGEAAGQHRVSLTLFPAEWGGFSGEGFTSDRRPRDAGTGLEFVGPPAPRPRKDSERL